MTVADRIDAALKRHGGGMPFYDLAIELYGDREKYPRAFRYSSNGGPPGCYMALSAAIRRYGYGEAWRGIGPGNRIIYPRQKQTR